MAMMRWVLDLDNTLVKTEGSDYENSTPIPKAVAKVQEYKRRGDHIIIMTARGSGSKKDWREFTAKQLDDFGIPFDQLIVGLKPGGVDVFVDDKAINALDWLADEKRALSRIETKEHKKDIQIFDPYFPYAKEIFDKLEVDPEDFNKNRSDD
jgi:capsule biosynthesis phosphatase